MTPKEFFDLVARMRKMQQEYFRTRTSASLSVSKKLERAVDAEIERVNRITNDSRNLFPKHE